MDDSHRYLPAWPLPTYIFVPGENPHPKKVGGHMEGLKDPDAPVIDVVHPEKNEHLRYALDLYNHGYFWESHVYFEALWNAHKRQGSVADFLKALIKLGAAGVKISIEQKEAAKGHYERALELINEVQSVEGDTFLGFELDQLKNKIQKTLSSNDLIMKVYPSWS